MTERTRNGIRYTESLAGSDGMGFILFPSDGDTPDRVAAAVQELRRERDVVALRVATPDDRDEDYVTEIFRQPAVKHLRWYEIYAGEWERIRREREAGTTAADYVERWVLPFVDDTRLANFQRFGENIYQL